MDTRDDFGVPELLNPHRVDWTDRVVRPTVPVEQRIAVATEATSRITLRRPCDLSFIDDEGSWDCYCHEAGDDE